MPCSLASAFPTVVFVLLLTATATATSLDSVVYLTSNLTSVDTSPAVEDMVEALLNQMGAANVSIDAAIYDFERVSVRDKLFGASQCGVDVRIIAYDEAKANLSYARYFDALETTGLAIVDDQDSSRIMYDEYLIVDHKAVWTGSVNLFNSDSTLNHSNSIRFTSPDLATVYHSEFGQLLVGTFRSLRSATLTTTVVEY